MDESKKEKIKNLPAAEQGDIEPSQERKILQGARILAEANDLKRTAESLAQELGITPEKMNKVIAGNCSVQEQKEVIEKMGVKYPLDHNDLYIIEDDCKHGVKIMRAEESAASSRIFKRKDRDNNRTPYYEYRDTVMSRVASFRPEWIKELRVVDNNSSENPDVAYNNGHSMHQTTFFIGPVNFYWEVNGKKYCREMNTGDSNYITPYWAHSFSCREDGKNALILAVTFGGDVRRAQKELYALGERAPHYVLNHRLHAKGVLQLITQHMRNENITQEILQEMITEKNPDFNIEVLFREKKELSSAELQVIADALHIEIPDIFLSNYRENEEVVIKHRSEEKGYFYPNVKRKAYHIRPMARTSKMPLMKGFDLEILSPKIENDSFFISSLHSWIYNYGQVPIKIQWEEKSKRFEEVINSNDSIYIQPFVKHAFLNTTGNHGTICNIRVSGAVNLATQRELSYLSDTNRIIESECWFN